MQCVYLLHLQQCYTCSGVLFFPLADLTGRTTHGIDRTPPSALVHCPASDSSSAPLCVIDVVLRVWRLYWGMALFLPSQGSSGNVQSSEIARPLQIPLRVHRCRLVQPMRSHTNVSWVYTQRIVTQIATIAS